MVSRADRKAVLKAIAALRASRGSRIFVRQDSQAVLYASDEAAANSKLARLLKSSSSCETPQAACVASWESADVVAWVRVGV